MPLCSGSQYPSTPSLVGPQRPARDVADQPGLRGGRPRRARAGQPVRRQRHGHRLRRGHRRDAAGEGPRRGPDLVDVDAVELYGQPPYSGFVDDPICLANGNLLLRDGDVQLFGVAAALSVVRTYNCRDRRAGVFGTGWSSLLDVALAVEERRVTFRGPDGAGAVFHAPGRTAPGPVAGAAASR